MFLSALHDLYRLRRNQWLKTSQLEEIQRKKLRRMVRHAYENVRYYRKLFDSAGVRPEDIRTVEDLSKIPITTRKQLQQLPLEEVIAEGVNIDKCKKITTSGSSGIPLKVILTKRDSTFYDMVWARASLENGQRLWDKVVCFKFHMPQKLWFQHLGIWRKVVLSVLDGRMERVTVLKRIRHDVIRGNSFEIINIARCIKENGIEGINPRLVFSMGSFLDETSREFVNSTFRTKMFDHYGMTELGCIAWECKEHRGYHINVETVVLELIKGDRSASVGEKGKLVCTGLHSFAMPFIRYDTGDVGIMSDEKCHCGRGLPMLKSIEGRADDFFISADGNMYSPSVIVNQIKLISGISHYRIVQETETEIVAWLVPDNDFSQQTKNEIKRTMQRMMGNNINVKVKVVDAISSDPMGKIRQLVSKVKAGKNF